METTNQLETIHRGVALALVLLDDRVHTDEHPFCSDLAHACHEDFTLIAKYLVRPVDRGLLTITEAVNLYCDRQLGASVTLAGAFKCACPLSPVRCSNPVSGQNGICSACITGDHSGHFRMRGDA